MQSWMFFITLITNACCVATVIDWAIELPFGFSSKLSSLLTQLCYGYLSWTPESLFETGELPVNGQIPAKATSHNRKALIEPEPSSTDPHVEGLPTILTLADRLAKLPRLSKACANLRGPVAKGGSTPSPTEHRSSLCPIHPGATLHCQTFFQHRGYSFKLLECGELYVCDSTYSWRLIKDDVPLESNQPFVVDLRKVSGGSFLLSFHPSCRLLGELNTGADTWELTHIPTYCPTGFDADGSMVMEDGQGCAFDRVYNGSSATSPRDEAGWGCYSADEQLFEQFLPLFATGDKCPSFSSGNSQPLTGSIHGIDGVANGWSPQDIQVYPAEIGPVTAQPMQSQPSIVSQAAPNVISSAGFTTLPPMPATPTGTLPTSTGSPPTTSRTIMRRTCTICQRVMRRPSALTIHMNSHYGHKPFKCQACPYGSTNITNLIRHQRTTGHTDSTSSNN